MGSVEPPEFVLKTADIGHFTDERQAHDVGMCCHEREVLEVFVGERLDCQVGVGHVDALAALQVGSTGADIVDDHHEMVVFDVVDVATDLAVVEPDRFPHSGCVEQFGQRAAHDDRGVCGLVLGRGRHSPSEHDAVAVVDPGDRLGRLDSHDADPIAGVVVRTRQLGVVGEIRGLRTGEFATGVGRLHHRPAPTRTTRIDQFDHIARPPARQPRRVVDLHRRSVRRRDSIGTGQADRCRGHDPAECVALGLRADHGWSCGQRLGAQLGATEIHGDQNCVLVAAMADVADHLRPCIGVVVGAIDASDVHAALDHGVDQIGSFGGVGRKRHHDARAATRCTRTEQVGRVRCEQEVAFGDAHHMVVIGHVTASCEPRECCEHGIDGGHDM